MDHIFNKCLIQKKENYEECANFTPVSLMLDALNRFQSLKAEEKCKNASPENNRIVALIAQIQETNKMLLGTKLRLKSQSEKGKTRNMPRNFHKRYKQYQNKKNKIRKEFEEWKKIPQKEGEPEEKIWNKKKYYYCDEHQVWGRHKESDCRGRDKKLHSKTSNQEGNSNDNVANLATYENDDFLTSIAENMMDK